jgi:hypothetical protein
MGGEPTPQGTEALAGTRASTVMRTTNDDHGWRRQRHALDYEEPELGLGSGLSEAQDHGAGSVSPANYRARHIGALAYSRREPAGV